MRPVVISVGLVTVHVEREARPDATMLVVHASTNEAIEREARVDDSRLIAEPMLVNASDVPAIASTKSKRRDD